MNPLRTRASSHASQHPWHQRACQGEGGYNKYDNSNQCYFNNKCDLIRAVPNIDETRSFFSPLGLRIISSTHSHSLCMIHMALHRDKSQGTQPLLLSGSLWSGRHPHEPQGQAEAAKSKPACNWQKASVASHYTTIYYWIYCIYFYIHFSKKR